MGWLNSQYPPEKYNAQWMRRFIEELRVILNDPSLIVNIEGTTNQVNVSNDGEGTVTLSTPQSISTASNVQFGNITGTGLVKGSTGHFGGNTHYSEFEADGTYVAKGNAITWRDEYVGGEWFVPTGATAADIVDYTIGGVATKKYSFDGTTTIEKIGNTFEIPHDMAITQVNNGDIRLEFHLHIAPSTNAASVGCVFEVDWCYIPLNGAPIAGTKLTLKKTFSANSRYYNYLVDGDFAVPSGGFGVGGLIEFTVSRTPAATDDTYTSDVIFYKAAMHVPCDTLGSRSEYSK